MDRREPQRPTAGAAPIALTMGEPAGICGEITLKAWAALAADGPPFAAVADAAWLRRAAARLGLDTPIVEIADMREAAGVFRSALPVLPMPLAAEAEPGRLDVRNAGAVVASIERSVALVQAGCASAVVTNPIQKKILAEGGFPFPGHTEFLGHLAGAGRAVMMLAGAGLRVVPITIHVPLRQAPDALTVELVVETARIVAAELRVRFGVPAPRLALAGLNPHAGEDGALGHEEREVLRPAAQLLRAEGIDITDPLPADTMFHPRARSRYDAALCPTHDQALIPLKMLAFDEGVNITLGLPFVRTSPDHGTALDIAGQGVARPDSLIAAIVTAAEMSAG